VTRWLAWTGPAAGAACSKTGSEESVRMGSRGDFMGGTSLRERSNEAGANGKVGID